MDSDKSVTATFTRNQYTVNLVAEPQEGGTVAGGGVYSFGDEATITSQASDCYLFTAGMRMDYWSARAQSIVSQSMVTENLKRDS
jgi:phage baseplate assembly protein gpV